MLELTDAVVILILGIAVALVVRNVLTSKFEYLKAKQNRYAKQFTPKKDRVTSQEKDVPEWLYNALDQLGIDESLLEEEEMPPELAKLLPLAKGFIEGGGVERLLGKQQQQEDQQPTGGQYW
jgi:hypothetical protein